MKYEYHSKNVEQKEIENKPWKTPKELAYLQQKCHAASLLRSEGDLPNTTELNQDSVTSNRSDLNTEGDELDSLTLRLRLPSLEYHLPGIENLHLCQG